MQDPTANETTIWPDRQPAQPSLRTLVPDFDEGNIDKRLARIAAIKADVESTIPECKTP